MPSRARTSKVTSTVSVKGTDGVTRTARLNVGATGLTDAAFAEAAKHGATLSESLKEALPDGGVKTKKNTIKADDITPKVAGECVNASVGSTPSPTIASKLTVYAGRGIDIAAAPEPTPSEDALPSVWVPDSTAWVARVTGLLNTMIGLLAGFLAGRTDLRQQSSTTPPPSEEP